MKPARKIYFELKIVTGNIGTSDSDWTEIFS